MNSKVSLRKLLNPIASNAGWIFAALAIIGFLDASYLTANHYLGTELVCPVFGNCEKVTTSPYAAVFGVPVALFGAIYYLFIFIMSVLYIDSGSEKLLRFLAKFTAIGFLASLWFLYLQLFVIYAICLYCVGSAITSTLLFISGVCVLKFRETAAANVLI